MTYSFADLLVCAAVTSTVACLIFGATRLYGEFFGRTSRRIRKAIRPRDLQTTDQALLVTEQKALTGWKKTFYVWKFDTERNLSQAGWSYGVSAFASCTFASGLFFWLIAVVIQDNPVFSIVAFALGIFLPLFLVANLRAAAMNQLSQQLPDALDLMSRSLRAGSTVEGSMQIVASTFPRPISPAFQTFSDQLRLGLPFDNAIEQMALNLGIADAKIFCVAMLIQRQSGGNLCEVLERLSSVVKVRHRLQGRIHSLTGEGRMQANVLTSLPFGSFLMIWFIEPAYAEKLLASTWLLGGVCISMLIGGLWIRQIVRIEY